MAKNRGGRKKLELEKIKDDLSLRVTFSKRRYGVFKKASELCTLCGAQIGLIVFSPSGQAFSFGNPDIKSVINLFKNYMHYSLQPIENGPNATIQSLNNLLTQESSKLESEKEKTKILEQTKNKREEMEKWWEKPPNELNLTQINHLISVLEDLRMDLGSQSSQYSQAFVPQNHYVGSYNNSVGGGNIDLLDQTRMTDVSALTIPNHGPMHQNNNVGGGNINLLDQTRMIDVSALTIPNHGPMLGYDQNNNVFEGFPSL